MATKTIDITVIQAPKADAKASKAPGKADGSKAKAPKADAPKADARKAPAKADPKPTAKPRKGETFAIHVNKTGRVCFGKEAAARIGDSRFCTLAAEKGIIRLQPTNKATEDALPVRDASGRPYISATKQFKPLGFDGTRAMDIDAKPYGNAGFEFRLA